jgi:hypothetical protein
MQAERNLRSWGLSRRTNLLMNELFFFFGNACVNGIVIGSLFCIAPGLQGFGLPYSPPRSEFTIV